MSLIKIEPFTLTQREAVAHLILHIQQQEFGVPVSLQDQPDLMDITAYYQKGEGNFWVASIDELVVGTISLLDIGQAQGALRKMFVAQAYRGKEFGVATKLLQTLMLWSTEHRFKEIFLGTTDKFLAAHRFYEKNGFVSIAKTDLPTKFPVMAVDTKFYCRRIASAHPPSLE